MRQQQVAPEAAQQARVRGAATQQQAMLQVRVSKAPQPQFREPVRDSNRNAAASPPQQYEEGGEEGGEGEHGEQHEHVGQLTVTHTATGDAANTSNLDGATLEDHSDAEEQHELADDEPNANANVRRLAPAQQQQQRAPAAYPQQLRGRAQPPPAPADASDNEEGVVLWYAASSICSSANVLSLLHSVPSAMLELLLLFIIFTIFSDY